MSEKYVFKAISPDDFEVHEFEIEVPDKEELEKIFTQPPQDTVKDKILKGLQAIFGFGKKQKAMGLEVEQKPQEEIDHNAIFEAEQEYQKAVILYNQWLEYSLHLERRGQCQYGYYWNDIRQAYETVIVKRKNIAILMGLTSSNDSRLPSLPPHPPWMKKMDDENRIRTAVKCSKINWQIVIGFVVCIFIFIVGVMIWLISRDNREEQKQESILKAEKVEIEKKEEKGNEIGQEIRTAEENKLEQFSQQTTKSAEDKTFYEQYEQNIGIPAVAVVAVGRDTGYAMTVDGFKIEFQNGILTTITSIELPNYYFTASEVLLNDPKAGERISHSIQLFVCVKKLILLGWTKEKAMSDCNK